MRVKKDITVSRTAAKGKHFTTWCEYTCDFNNENRCPTKMTVALDFHGILEEEFPRYLTMYHGKSKKMGILDLTAWGLSWETIIQSIITTEGIDTAEKFDKMQGWHLPRQLRPF